MPTTDQTILLTIFENPNASVRTLRKKTGISPRILQTHLRELRKKGLVHQERPEGPAKAYPSILTEKGTDYICDERLFNDFWREAAGPLKMLQNLTARIAQDPKKLSQLRRSMRLTRRLELRKLEHGKLTIKEYAKRVDKRSKDDPLRESLKAIYDIFLRMSLPRREKYKEGLAIAMLEKGSVCLIPVALLRKRGFILREPEKELDLGFPSTESCKTSALLGRP